MGMGPREREKHRERDGQQDRERQRDEVGRYTVAPSGNLGALCGDGNTAVSSVALEQMSGRIFSFRVLEALPVLLAETGLGCVGSKFQGALPAEALLSHPAHLLCTGSFSHGGHC